MVSEVSFPTFWGVIRTIKVVSVFRLVIGSAVPKISRFAHFYVRLVVNFLFGNWQFHHSKLPTSLKNKYTRNRFLNVKYICIMLQ